MAACYALLAVAALPCHWPSLHLQVLTCVTSAQANILSLDPALSKHIVPAVGAMGLLEKIQARGRHNGMSLQLACTMNAMIYAF